MRSWAASIPATALPRITTACCAFWAGASNRSFGNILRKSAEDYRALKANGVGGLSALAWKNLSKLPQFFR